MSCDTILFTFDVISYDEKMSLNAYVLISSGCVDVLKTSNPDYIDSINTKDDIVKLNKYINVLSDREKKIIIKRYGLYGEKEITQKKVADELNISRSYVSRIEKRALTKLLREFIRNNHR